MAAHRIDLGNNGDAERGERVGHGDRRAQACPAATDHEDIAGENIHDPLNQRTLRRGARPRQGVSASVEENRVSDGPHGFEFESRNLRMIATEQ